MINRLGIRVRIPLDLEMDLVIPFRNRGQPSTTTTVKCKTMNAERIIVSIEFSSFIIAFNSESKAHLIALNVGVKS